MASLSLHAHRYRSHRGLSIQSRFLLYFGPVVVALMAMVIFTVGHRMSRSMREQTEMRGQAVANSIAAVTTNALLSYDYPSLQSAADDAKQDTGAAYVIILDKEHVVAGYSGRPALQGQRLADRVSTNVEESEGVLIQSVPADDGAADKAQVLDVAVPVFVAGSPVQWGTIRVGLSLADMDRELAEVQRVLALLGVGAVFIVMLFARYFTSRITKPLKNLADATALIASGDLDHSVDEDMVGELGDLARSFNKMTNDLRRSRDAVRYQNQHLENMVQERTAALRQKARELEKANEELKVVDRLKSDFLSNVSHELRTPLTSIRSFTEILLDDSMPLERIEQVEFLGIVSSQAERLTRLINDLLDLSKIEAGEFHCQVEILDLSEQVVYPCLETLRTIATEKQVELRAVINQELPKVIGDCDRLSQVVMNLIDNAIKFTPAGGKVEVHAGCGNRRRPSNGDSAWAGMEADTPEMESYVIVKVRDTGVGIEPRDQQLIFEKFGQVGNVLTDKPQGTGLGLAISGSIMVQHGGALWVESRPGEGSTFTFSLPAAMERESSPSSGSEEALPTDASADPADLVAAIESVAQGKRVLVVDDEPAMVSAMTELLEPHGFRAVGCHHGNQAVDKARDLKPDAIVLDAMMPGIDGYDVLRMLKSDLETSQIPVILLSHNDDDAQAYELGAACFLKKPRQAAELLTSVRQPV